MKRSELSIGDRVLVIPPTLAQKSYKMYVRELHNPQTAGLSHKPRGKSIYGILYEVIHPLPESPRDYATKLFNAFMDMPMPTHPDRAKACAIICCKHLIKSFKTDYSGQGKNFYENVLKYLKKI